MVDHRSYKQNLSSCEIRLDFRRSLESGLCPSPRRTSGEERGQNSGW